MSLISYPVTAIEENFADAQSSGKNTVASAVITLTDLDGNPVTMFDDASASNGSTTKVTGANGTKDIYVEAGEYNMSINGGTARRITVGSYNPIEVQTFSQLQAIKTTLTGQRLICRERANAEYVLQASGYTALAGDVTLSNGRVGRLQVNTTINSGWFGLSSSNTAIQNDSAISLLLSYAETVNTRDLSPTIEIPTGRFLFNNIEIGNRGDETGLLNGRIIIKGQGPLNTQLVCQSANGDALKITSGRVNISDLSITSDGVNRSKTVGSGSGIVIDSTDGVNPSSVTVAKFYMSNIEVANQPDDGFKFVNTELLYCRGLTSEENGGYGYNFDGDNYGGDIKGISNYMVNCRSYRNSSDGYRVNQTSECTFINPQALENDGDYQFWSNSRGTKIISPDFESKTASSNLVGCLLAGDNSSIENGLVFGVETGVILQGDGQKVDYVTFSNTGLGYNMTAVNTVNATNYTVNIESANLSSKNVTVITNPINVHDGGLQRVGGVTSFAGVATSLNTFEITSNTPTAFGDNYGGAIESACYNVLLSSNAVILAPTTFSNNQEFEIIFQQDATGGRVVTFSGSQWVENFSNTGNTSGKVSSVKFKVIFDDHNSMYKFVQIGAQLSYV